MLRRNLATQFNLVNGAIGVVTDIIIEPGQDMPVIIMVHFENYNGPTINGSVPIAPFTATWTSGQTECSRLQFPLILCFAITIHKSQGMTLSRAILNIGSSERQLGLTYVALSRLTSLENLALECAYDYSRFERIKNSRLFQKRQQEEVRLNSIAL